MAQGSEDMKFAVIGHIVLDTIVTRNRKEIRSYGGIFFSLASLATLASPDDVIYPVFGIGKEDYPSLLTKLQTYPNIDPSGIYPFEGLTNSVHIEYGEYNRRVECSRNIAEPIAFSSIEKYLNVDGILINMISGFDITVDTLDAIRMATRNRNTPIHLDIHSLALGIKEDFTRYYRPLPEWRRWCFMIDTVQMNEDEAANISLDNDPEDRLVKGIFALGANRVLITRGERGATMYSIDQKNIVRRDQPPHPVKRGIDPTGSGDVFGAAFFLEYARTHDEARALEFAARAGAANATYPGSTGIDRLPELIGISPLSHGKNTRSSL